jgi:hypothetical protein
MTMASGPGLLIVNADDWGQDTDTTEYILNCVSQKAVTSVSAMVFMDDSERAAALAREHDLDVGLHLNFTAPFTACASTRVVESQNRIRGYLRRHRLAQVVFNPVLVRSFDDVVAAQIDEFRRLYGANPVRLDGHHHMHLCSNVVLGHLMPPDTIVRRNLSFQPDEKSYINRAYRRAVDGMLARRHRLVDFLFSLNPQSPAHRLRRIVGLARRHVIELETHPAKRDEYTFLMSGELRRCSDSVRIGPPSPVIVGGTEPIR